MFALVQDLQELRIKRSKTTPREVLGIPIHIAHGRLAPLLDAQALANLSLLDEACRSVRERRCKLVRQKVRELCHVEGFRSPSEFAWDACFRPDFQWRLHAVWVAGMHIDDVLFYNHFKAQRCRAIDSAPKDGPLWNFLRAHGSRPNSRHNTFGTYAPIQAAAQEGALAERYGVEDGVAF